MRRPRAGDERASQSTRAARGAPPGGHYEPPAGRRLRGAAVTACPQTACRKAQPGAASSVYDCGRSGMKTTANEPGQRCSGGAPGGASASSQGGADTDELRQPPLARHPLASGGAKRQREDGPARGLDKEHGPWSLAKALTCLAFRKSDLYKPGITHADAWL